MKRRRSARLAAKRKRVKLNHVVLPPEIWDKVFSYLDCADKMKVRCVSREWKEIVESTKTLTTKSTEILSSGIFNKITELRIEKCYIWPIRTIYWMKQYSNLKTVYFDNNGDTTSMNICDLLRHLKHCPSVKNLILDGVSHYNCMIHIQYWKKLIHLEKIIFILAPHHWKYFYKIAKYLSNHGNLRMMAILGYNHQMLDVRSLVQKWPNDVDLRINLYEYTNGWFINHLGLYKWDENYVPEMMKIIESKPNIHIVK